VAIQQIRILVIEDAKQPRERLAAFLDYHLARVASKPETAEAAASLAPHVDQGGYEHEHGGYLSALVPHGWAETPDGAAADQWFPLTFDVKALQLKYINRLAAVAQGDGLRREQDNELMEILEEACRDKACAWSGLPDLIIVDLALSKAESGILDEEEAGAHEEIDARGRVRGEDGELLGPGERLTDPRSIVDRLTGFRVLAACPGDIPVIVTSQARNPLVGLHCRVHGAFAVLQKRLPNEPGKPTGYSVQRVPSVADIEHEVLGKAAPESVEVSAFLWLADAAANVLHAVNRIALERLATQANKPLLSNVILGAE
jgi:CheY-like chemotaxis protein